MRGAPDLPAGREVEPIDEAVPPADRDDIAGDRGNGVLDFGRTIKKAVSLIEAAGAASVQVAVALDKKTPGAVAKPDFVAFETGNDFVIGYGMDDAGRYRDRVMLYERATERLPEGAAQPTLTARSRFVKSSRQKIAAMIALLDSTPIFRNGCFDSSSDI